MLSSPISFQGVWIEPRGALSYTSLRSSRVEGWNDRYGKMRKSLVYTGLFQSFKECSTATAKETDRQMNVHGPKM